MSVYFELVSPTSNRTSVDITLKMLLMTILPLRLQPRQYHLILKLLPLPRSRLLLLPFHASFGTLNGFVHNYGLLVLIEEVLAVEFMNRRHSTHNLLPLASVMGDVFHLRRLPEVLAGPHESDVFG